MLMKTMDQQPVPLGNPYPGRGKAEERARDAGAVLLDEVQEECSLPLTLLAPSGGTTSQSLLWIGPIEE